MAKISIIYYLRKLHIKQFGFKEESDCNLTKFMMIYNAVEMGLKKQLLIDVRKAYDSLNREL